MSQAFLTDVGDFIFDTVFGFFNTMISVLTNGAITEFLGGYSEIEDFMADVGYWAATELQEAWQGVLDYSQQQWTAAYNTSHSGLLEVLDLSETIKRAYEELLRDAELVGGELVFAFQREAEAEADAAIVVADIAIDQLADKSGTLLDTAHEMYEGMLEREHGETDRFLDVAKKALDDMGAFVEADLLMAQAAAEAESEAVSTAILTVATEDVRLMESWWLETTIKPLAYGDQILWALQESAKLDMPETMRQIQEVMIEWHKVNSGMIDDGLIVPPESDNL